MVAEIRERIVDDDGNINITQGNDLILKLTIKDGAGVALDITNWEVYMTVKIKSNDPDVEALIEKKITAHTDPTNGITEIHVTEAENTLDPGTYRYDVKVKNSSGLFLTYIRNRKYIVEQSITDKIA